MAARCDKPSEAPYMYEDEHPEVESFVPAPSPFAGFEALAQSYSPLPEDQQSGLRLEERVANYLSTVASLGKPPTLAGLSRALGINSGHLKQAIREYSSSSLSTDSYFGRVMAWALSEIEAYIEEGMLSGTINAAAAKFALTRMGWDQAPTTQNISLNMSIDQIDMKLAALLSTDVRGIKELISTVDNKSSGEDGVDIL